jgi:hypothetical protein
LSDTSFYREKTVECGKNPKRLKESFFSVPIELQFNYYNILGKDLKEITKWLIQGGIIQNWFKYYRWHKFDLGQNFEDESGPQVFSIDSVSYGFNVWMIACAVSILGFIYEWIQVIKN